MFVTMGRRKKEREPKHESKRSPSVLKKHRNFVLARDGFRCRVCGQDENDGITKLHIDHIIPVSKGGINDVENLQTLCAACNYGKHNILLDDFSWLEVFQKQVQRIIRIRYRGIESDTEGWHNIDEKTELAPILKYRFEIFKACRFRCCVCNRDTSDGVKLLIDHKGNKLQALCEDCSNEKSDMLFLLLNLAKQRQTWKWLQKIEECRQIEAKTRQEQRSQQAWERQRQRIEEWQKWWIERRQDFRLIKEFVDPILPYSPIVILVATVLGILFWLATLML